MITFDVNPFSLKSIEPWLWDNIGIGGKWLKDLNGDLIIEHDDKWGYWYNNGYIRLAIMEEKDAIIFNLRWNYD